MSRVVKELDEAERQQMEAQADGIAETPHPQVDVFSGREFVFVAHFDGTLNDKDNLKEGEHQTNVANLNDLMKPHNNENFVSHYYRGVGTHNSGLVSGWKASISPSSDMRRTAKEAYEQFSADASEWLRNHPEADPATSLKVMATGFSRGGVTMAMFSQKLYEEGLVAEDGEILVPPGILGLSGGIVYDPVSKGYKGNAAFSPTSRNITEVQATAEYRSWFKDVDHDADPNVSTVEVIGNHSNIGGSYDLGISARVLESSREWFAKTGIPINEIPEHMRYRADEPVRIYEERDLPGMERTRKISGSHLVIGTAATLAGGGVIKPLQALIPKGVSVLAGKADYPRTHDPREGLDVPRQQRSSARHQQQMGDGWQRFEGVDGVVWSKDYPGPNPLGMTRAVMVERNLPGRNNDRIDLYLTHTNGEVERQQQPIAAGRRMQRMGAESRQRLDQNLSPSAEQRLMQNSLETWEHKSDQHLQQKVERRLERKLDRQLNRVSAEGSSVSDDRGISISGQTTAAADLQQRRTWQEMAQAFRSDPNAALAQYPSDDRVRAAKAVFDEVGQYGFNNSRQEAVYQARAHRALARQLERGKPISSLPHLLAGINRSITHARGGIGD